MKKEDLLKLEGMTEDLAAKILDLNKTDLENMVPRSRLNEIIAERDAAKNDHAEVLKKLGTLEKENGDVQSLKDQIAQLQNDAKEAQKTHDAEIKRMKIDNAIESALAGANARNMKAVKALLTDLDKAELDTDGTVKGLADQIKALQSAEDSKFLFGSGKEMKGAKHGESGNEDPDHGVDINKMTYTELAAYMAEHPDVKIE